MRVPCSIERLVIHVIIAHVMGAVAHGVSSFPKGFVFASLCSFICLMVVYQLSGMCKFIRRY